MLIMSRLRYSLAFFLIFLPIGAAQIASAQDKKEAEFKLEENFYSLSLIIYPLGPQSSGSVYL